MVKIYGVDGCPYCEFIKPQVEGREDEYRYINIGENRRVFKEFMALRDNRPEFENDKAMGRAGVPAFLLEDGTITFNPYDVGLERLGGRP